MMFFIFIENQRLNNLSLPLNSKINRLVLQLENLMQSDISIFNSTIDLVQAVC